MSPDNPPQKVVAAIAVHNRLAFTKLCLQRLFEGTEAKVQLLVVDDGSSDGTSEWLRSAYPQVILLRGDGSLWFGGAMQKAIEYFKDNLHDADYFLTLNNDAFVAPGCLDQLVRESSGEYVVGAMLLSGDKRILQCFGAFWNWWKGWTYPYSGDLLSGHAEFRLNVVRRVGMLNTTCTLIPAKWLRIVRGIDPVKYPQHRADTQLLSRISKAGAQLRVSSAAVATHDDEEAGHIRYSSWGKRPEEYLRDALLSRTCPVHLPSAVSSLWETAPSKLASIPPITRAVIYFIRGFIAAVTVWGFRKFR